MNKFELFCMIYYVLDADWEDTHDEHLGMFLSDMNPFLWSDIGSATPEIYQEFSKTITEPITIANSYGIALKYIKSLHDDIIEKAFAIVDAESWKKSVKGYLAQMHKGVDLND